MTEIVSVIVPVYNVERHLARCLESITNQTYPYLEIILVDDGSTDGSPDIIRNFAARDSRVRAIVQKNAGVSAARNAGLDAATGAFVSFVDADDWLEPDAFACIVNEAATTDLDFVTFGYFVDYPGRSVIGVTLSEFQGTLDTRSGLETVLAGWNRFVWTRVYRRELIGSTRFREDIHWGEDTIFVVEVVRRANSSAVIHKPLYHYVQSEGSATRSRVNPKRLTGPEMTRILENLVKVQHPHLVDYVLQTRLGVLAILIQDAYELPRNESAGLVSEFRKQVRTDLGRIIGSPVLSVQTKAKAFAIALSPRLFVAARRIVSTIRSARD